MGTVEKSMPNVGLIFRGKMLLSDGSKASNDEALEFKLDSWLAIRFAIQFSTARMIPQS